MFAHCPPGIPAALSSLHPGVFFSQQKVLRPSSWTLSLHKVFNVCPRGRVDVSIRYMDPGCPQEDAGVCLSSEKVFFPRPAMFRQQTGYL